MKLKNKYSQLVVYHGSILICDVVNVSLSKAGIVKGTAILGDHIKPVTVYGSLDTNKVWKLAA